ncbi:NifB/NifX family molybdenum-iron cluster-binding protein [Cetobacterium ceti]|nr:NifB/NifX family molybdenum-iron cluster-binding protein [Cetobacterium ceti]
MIRGENMAGKKKFRNCRLVNNEVIFKPLDIPFKDLEIINIDIDEFEAIRLSDYEGKNQIETGESMKVSRGTVQRLLASGRKKIMEAFLHEKALCIKNNKEYFDELQLNTINRLSQLKEMENTFKIAFPTSDDIHIEEHFGRSEKFIIYTLSKGEVINKESILTPDHGPGVFPKLLFDNNVNIIVCDSMGPRAINFFREYNIEVLLGATGEVDLYWRGFYDNRNTSK